MQTRRQHLRNITKNIRLDRDPSFRLYENHSRAIRRFLKSNKVPIRSKVWINLPYSPKELRQHLENQFEPWMHWDNYGIYGWCIDHIVPRSKLPYTGFNDPNFLLCWGLENLRPMKSILNFSKGNNENSIC